MTYFERNWSGGFRLPGVSGSELNGRAEAAGYGQRVHQR